MSFFWTEQTSHLANLCEELRCHCCLGNSRSYITPDIHLPPTYSSSLTRLNINKCIGACVSRLWVCVDAITLKVTFLRSFRTHLQVLWPAVDLLQVNFCISIEFYRNAKSVWSKQKPVDTSPNKDLWVCETPSCSHSYWWNAKTHCDGL